MWQNCQSRSLQHNETNTLSDSLPVYCHSSSSRYFKFDFKTLCTPMISIEVHSVLKSNLKYLWSIYAQVRFQWRHYWCWKCVQCTCEMQEPRPGWVPLLANLKLGYWSLWQSQYSMAVHVTGGPWQIWQTFVRPTDNGVEMWEQGTADRHLATW